MNEREEQIHLVRNLLVAGWYVIAYVDWLSSIASAKLGNIRNRSVVQCPQSVFIERLDALNKPYFDAVCQEIVLAQQVLFLDSVVEIGMILIRGQT